MEAVLLVIHLIIALGIIVMVLIQPSESGGFLGSGGSMSNMMAPRRRGDVLTRMTAILAASFFVTSLMLAVMASHRPATQESILDQAIVPVTAPAAEAPQEEGALGGQSTPQAPIAP